MAVQLTAYFELYHALMGMHFHQVLHVKQAAGLQQMPVCLRCRPERKQTLAYQGK